MNFYRATIFLAISGLSRDIEAVNLRGCGSLEEQNRRVDVNRLNQLKINFDGFQELTIVDYEHEHGEWCTGACYG
jgi:hypothetical protein